MKCSQLKMITANKDWSLQGPSSMHISHPSVKLLLECTLLSQMALLQSVQIKSSTSLMSLIERVERILRRYSKT